MKELDAKTLWALVAGAAYILWFIHTEINNWRNR